MKFLIPDEQRKLSGIYKITNSIDHRVLVGSTTNFRRRYIGYLTRFRHKKNNPYFQSFGEKHGIHCLSFELLELVVCEKPKLLEREQYWLDYYKSYERDKGFNIYPIAGSCLGSKWSEEKRKAFSEKLKKFHPRKGIPRTEDVKEQISKTLSKASVVQYSLEGKFIKKWSRIREAEQELNLVKGGIFICCKGRKNHEGGFLWRFSIGDNDPIEIPSILDTHYPVFYESQNCLRLLPKKWIVSEKAKLATERNARRQAKKVVQMSLDGTHIEVFNSLTEASKKTGCPRVSIQNCCKGNYKTSLGFRWKFAEAESFQEAEV